MRTSSNERSCCVRERVGECHTLAMIAYSESRPRWHNERRQAKVNVRPRSSPFSTTRTTRTSHGAMHIPGRSVNVKHCGLSVSVPLWKLYFCVLSVCWFLVISLAHALFQFGSRKSVYHRSTIFLIISRISEEREF